MEEEKVVDELAARIKEKKDSLREYCNHVGHGADVMIHAIDHLVRRGMEETHIIDFLRKVAMVIKHD